MPVTGPAHLQPVIFPQQTEMDARDPHRHEFGQHLRNVAQESNYRQHELELAHRMGLGHVAPKLAEEQRGTTWQPDPAVTNLGATDAEMARPDPGAARRSNIERGFLVNESVDPGSQMPEPGLIPRQLKVATTPEEALAAEQNEAAAGNAAAALLGGGVAYGAGSAATPALTGRRTHWHGTAPQYVDKILSEGIRPAVETGQHGITKAVVGREIANLPLVYAATNKDLANEIAHTAEWLRRPGNMNAGRQNWAEERTQHLMDNMSRKSPGLLELSLPHDFVTTQKRVNPEVLGPQFQLYKALYPEGARALERDTVALEGAIPSKYIKGHAGYQGLSTPEFLNYVKKHPKNFAKGVGLGALGLGAAGLAANRAYRAAVPAEKQAAWKAQHSTAGCCVALSLFGLEKIALGPRTSIGIGKMTSPGLKPPSMKPPAALKPPKPVSALDPRTDKPAGMNLMHGVQTMSNGADVNASIGAFNRRLQGAF